MCLHPQTRPQEATFLASLLQHQPSARPSVDALLRSNLLPALHASLPSRRSGAAAAAMPAPSPSTAAAAAAASVSPVMAAKLPAAAVQALRAPAKAGTATPASGSVQQPAGGQMDGESAAQRRQAVAAAAEDQEVSHTASEP